MVLRRATVPLILRLADAVTVIGEDLVREHPGLERLGERMIVVMPPVDAGAFTPSPERRAAARAELGVPDGAFVVGTVGNRNPSKGHEHLIRAAALLRQSHPDSVVRVLGAPSPVHASYEEQVRSEARTLGLDDPGTLRFVDPSSRVPDLISAFDVFVLSSVPRSEGMPTVILEAMASTLPVVATDVGAVAEVVEEGVTGFVIAPGDDEAIASAVGRLAADPELRQRLGENGRRRVLERYDTESLADQHARAYDLAIEHRAARSSSRARRHRPRA
jgi:glycosyltransferase involved in cell wall biosynthesis